VRRSLIPSLVPVKSSHDVGVDHEPFVRVDTDAKETGISVNLEDFVTIPQIVENAGLVEDGQVGHVLLLLELGRIAIEDFRFGNAVRPFGSVDLTRVASSGDLSLDVNFLRIGNPAIDLGVEWRGSLGQELLHW
jgi:hypothetical protein